jgi:hypothetical protein
MGSGGGSTPGSYIAAQAPDVFTPTAPEVSAAEAMPDNIDQAGFTSGAKRTESEKKKASLSTSRLVIPLTEGTSQAGGYTSPATPTGVV